MQISTARSVARPGFSNLDKLLSPASVAIVGASQREGRVNGAIRNLKDLGFAGQILPVNPKYPTVMGYPCYPSLGAIPEPVDLVVVGIPSQAVPAVLEEAHACGIPAAVIISSGFGETGEEGRRLQAEIAEFIARTGMLVCGPNCLGAIDFHAPAAGYYSASPKDCVAGDLAVVSQSGTIVVALVRGERPIGFSYLVSSGNEVGVSSAEYIRHFVDDSNTRVIGAFLEGVNKPDAFLQAAQAAREAGKPIITMMTGRSDMGRAASAAHTGSLAGSFEVQRAVFRQAGIVQCDDIDEWIEAIELFRHGRVPKAAGIGMIGVSGGENSLALDQMADNDLLVPALSEAGARALTEILPSYAHVSNPIDTSGGLGDNRGMYRQCLEILAAEPEIGIIIVSQDSPAYFDELAAEAIVEVAAKSDKSFIFLNNISRPATPAVERRLREARVPYLQGLRPGVKAIAAYLDYHLTPRRPAPAPELKPSRRNEARALLAKQGRLVTEDVGKAVLALYGFPVVSERVVAGADEAAEAADQLGYPVVAKLLSPDIAHKMLAGAVRLGLRSPEAVSEAVVDMEATVRDRSPGARIEGFAVQAMLPEGLEIILGMKRDEHFGPTLLVGLGGTFVEVVRAFSMRRAPVSTEEARAMVEEVPLLGSLARKLAPDADVAGIVAPLITSLSDLCAELDEDVEEIDVNPVILDPNDDQAVAVDALIVRRSIKGEDDGAESSGPVRAI